MTQAFPHSWAQGTRLLQVQDAGATERAGALPQFSGTSTEQPVWSRQQKEMNVCHVEQHKIANYSPKQGVLEPQANSTLSFSEHRQTRGDIKGLRKGLECFNDPFKWHNMKPSSIGAVIFTATTPEHVEGSGFMADSSSWIVPSNPDYKPTEQE